MRSFSIVPPAAIALKKWFAKMCQKSRANRYRRNRGVPRIAATPSPSTDMGGVAKPTLSSSWNDSLTGMTLLQIARFRPTGLFCAQIRLRRGTTFPIRPLKSGAGRQDVHRFVARDGRLSTGPEAPKDRLRSDDSLFVPQRHNRIDARRSARRNVCGGQSDSAKQQCHRCHRYRISRRDAVEQACHQTR